MAYQIRNIVEQILAEPLPMPDDHPLLSALADPRSLFARLPYRGPMAVSNEVCVALFELGVMSLLLAQDTKGTMLSWECYYRVIAAVARWNPAAALAAVQHGVAQRSILLLGDAGQQEELERLDRACCLFAVAHYEGDRPLDRYKTVLSLRARDYTLRGEKPLVAMGARADRLLVWARDHDAVNHPTLLLLEGAEVKATVVETPEQGLAGLERARLTLDDLVIHKSRLLRRPGPQQREITGLTSLGIAAVAQGIALKLRRLQQAAASISHDLELDLFAIEALMNLARATFEQRHPAAEAYALVARWAGINRGRRMAAAIQVPQASPARALIRELGRDLAALSRLDPAPALQLVGLARGSQHIFADIVTPNLGQGWLAEPFQPIAKELQKRLDGLSYQHLLPRESLSATAIDGLLQITTVFACLVHGSRLIHQRADRLSLILTRTGALAAEVFDRLDKRLVRPDGSICASR